MSFVTKKSNTFNYESPVDMYHDYKSSNKTIMGLLDYQSTLINEYMKKVDDKNIAIELPTGSGKTLVGLVIGEYRRRKHKEKVLFVCPTNQLVNQVKDYANNNYGIRAIAFCGKQSGYKAQDKADYLMAEAIGVTSYSSLFADNTFFSENDIIIMDDVHSSEGYIVDNWSVQFKRKDILFMVLAEFFKDIIGELEYRKLTCIDDEDKHGDWCNIIPNVLLTDKLNNIGLIIDTNIEKSANPSNKYAWKRIRENLSECNFYIEEGLILIRPWIAPTITHKPFASAKQRILMSATLGHSGELERITGLQKITKLPIVNDWDKKGVGRKFFILPSLSLEKDTEMNILLQLHKIAKRSIILTPKDKITEAISGIIINFSHGTKIFTAKDIEDKKDAFIKEKDAVVIMANRFDGIDFPDEESRMLIIVDLPRVVNIQEKFLVSRMGSNILYSERIKTRIIQAVGRCTRNTKDYSVVCILGNTIIKDLIEPSKLKCYSPELRAELEFGIENSKAYTSIGDILNNVKSFLNHDEEWKHAEEYIVEMRNDFIKEDEKLKMSLEKLGETASLEVHFQYALWKHNYLEAFTIISQIISKLNMQALNGYRSYWNYIGGTIAYKLLIDGKEEYRKIGSQMFQEVLKDNISIKWIGKLEQQIFSLNCKEANTSSGNFDDILPKLEKKLMSYSTKEKLEKKIQKILECLNDFGTKKGLRFEDGHTELGEIIGYISKNSDDEGAPDPYWIIGDDICIVAEDKMYEVDKKIPLEHVRQALTHENWLRNNEELITQNIKVITIFITNAAGIEENARQFADNIYYVNKETFISWAYRVLNVIRKLYLTFVEEGNIEWRESTVNEFIKNDVTPRDFINLVTQKKLCDL